MTTAIDKIGTGASITGVHNDTGATVLVSILGSDGVAVELKGSRVNAGSVLETAAHVLGVKFDATTSSVVRNGAPAHMSDTVSPGDRLTAAPNSGNG